MGFLIFLVCGIFITIGIFRSSGDGDIYRSAGMKEVGDRHDAQHAGSAFILIVIGILVVVALIMPD